MQLRCSGADPEYVPPRRAEVLSESFFGRGYQDILHRRPSIEKARTILGWEPATSLDEALGETHEDAPSFFEDLLDARPKADGHPVFTLHAELEGGPYDRDFATLLAAAQTRGVRCVTLGALLADRLARGPLPVHELAYGQVRGRHGVVSMEHVGGG